MDGINITVTREKQGFLFDIAVEVLMDSVKQGDLKSAQSIVFSVLPGEHRLEFKSGIRITAITADFTQDAAITLRFNRGSGEIEANISGATKKAPTSDWQNLPRDDNMVYPDRLKTSPTVSAVLSFLLVGLGQMINGQLIKGLLMLAVAFIVGALTGGVAAIVVWPLSAIDAYMSANKLKQGKSIHRFSFF